MIRRPAGWRGHRSPGWSTECSSSVQSGRQALGNCLEENNQLMLILVKRGRYSELVGSYQFHKQPLKPTCSGLPLCTEPAGEYLNHWQTHFLLSNKTWHRWCCNPLTKRWKRLTKEDYRILIKEPFTQRLFHPVTTKNFLDKAFLCYTVWGVKTCNFRWWHCSTYPQILYTTECIKNSCRAVGTDIYVIIICTCSKSCWKQVADCFIISHTHKATQSVGVEAIKNWFHSRTDQFLGSCVTSLDRLLIFSTFHIHFYSSSWTVTLSPQGRQSSQKCFSPRQVEALFQHAWRNQKSKRLQTNVNAWRHFP